MKKMVKVFVILLGILFIPLISASPVTHFLEDYCVYQGHFYNQSSCIFSINQSCSLEDFYYNHCGREFVIEKIPCAKENQIVNKKGICCEGLVPVIHNEYEDVLFLNQSTGECQVFSYKDTNLSFSGTMYCSSFPVICGDGECNPDKENKCTCPQDCGDPGCKNYYWYENTILLSNKEKLCDFEQFCGEFNYLGLRIFENVSSCQDALTETLNCPGGNYNDNICSFKPSKGDAVKILITPSLASQKVFEKLGKLTNFTITLIETKKGKVVYEISIQKNFKVLGLFSRTAYITAQVDTQTGNEVKIISPWWKFIATSSK
jgi:hypothetical protein